MTDDDANETISQFDSGLLILFHDSYLNAIWIVKKKRDPKHKKKQCK